MKDWEADKKASDVYLHEIKMILGAHLIGEPPIAEDQERNTDLIVMKMDSVRIACRVRKESYFERYGHEFTIRSGRPSGNKTELRKVVEGWGDFMFYGFGDGEIIKHWSLLDLKVFRSRLFSMALKNQVPIQKGNHDGSSSFMSFSIQNFPSSLVVASGDGVPLNQSQADNQRPQKPPQQDKKK